MNTLYLKSLQKIKIENRIYVTNNINKFTF